MSRLISNLGLEAASLCLSDGAVFSGALISGSEATGDNYVGEVVFNTTMTGYQEVITDPSYAGQMVIFTYPHLGNYGANLVDWESSSVSVRAVIAREYTETPSNWRSEESLLTLLQRHRVPLMVGVDTRRLTRHIRSFGALAGVIGVGRVDSLVEHARSLSGTEGIDLVSEVTPRETRYLANEGRPRIVAVDFGMKSTMVRLLHERFDLVIVPATTSAEEILGHSPDGVFLSNGPGDPSPLEYAISMISRLVGKVPIFGICLGHQLLALAQGAVTQKLAFGHHGANHPVSDCQTKVVEITSQNHNYAVSRDSLDKVDTRVVLTHVNLNDGVVEGLAYPMRRAFSVQYHPEAGPGPHDSRYLFDRFEALINGVVEFD